MRNGSARLLNADVRLGETRIMAEGLVHPTDSDMRVSLESSDLRNAGFIYSDANGSGTFKGTLTGPIATPILNGDFTIQNHTYQKTWRIEGASG